jgi:SAM-dependent methyltransferase
MMNLTVEDCRTGGQDMDEAARREFLSMVAQYRDRGDPYGWCDTVYRDAEGDCSRIYWADLVPNPCLLAWLAVHPIAHDGQRAVTVGCGLGDDAEALAAHGYRVTAFDISPTAIAMCHQRYPGSPVEYREADLFQCPVGWIQGFDLVFECNTIQIMPGDYRVRALNAIAGMVAPGGSALISCRSREAGEKLDEFPLPLDRAEMDGFIRAGLTEDSFVAYADDQNPPVPHFFACYSRPENRTIQNSST